MRFRFSVAAAILVAAGVALPGCRSAHSNAATGAAIGGLLGAGGGYAVGHHRGNRTNYALAGGVAGAMAGWIIGDQVDDRDRDTAGAPVYETAPRRRIVRERVIVHDPYAVPCDPYPPGW